ncbi:hypothetical protein [Bacillus xiapuensis]|nr:hypothetical protein [Bacillus xiapuensis]
MPSKISHKICGVNSKRPIGHSMRISHQRHGLRAQPGKVTDGCAGV